MNTLFLLLFITILILTLSSVNFIFLNDSFAIMIQDDNNEISLASTNDTFTESEPRIPPSALEEKDTSIIPNIETSQEAQTLQSNRSFIENIIKSEIRGENKSSIIATTNNNSALSQFYQLRNNYL